MKRLLLVILVLIITATVANAASVNGEYNGDPIVRVTSQGKELTVEDVPAVLYDGRTMVPIYLLRQIGVTVNWDQKTYTADVTLPQKVSDNNHLRVWAQVADYHARLDNLSADYIRAIERINAAGTASNLSNDNQYVAAHYEEVSALIDYLITDFDNIINNYSKTTRTNYASMAYPTVKLDTIERNFDELINDLLKTLKSLMDYYQNKSETRFNSYLDYANNTFEKIEKTRILIEEERTYFQNGIIHTP